MTRCSKGTLASIPPLPTFFRERSSYRSVCNIETQGHAELFAWPNLDQYDKFDHFDPLDEFGTLDEFRELDEFDELDQLDRITDIAVTKSRRLD